jgi:hypothetical protein
MKIYIYIFYFNNFLTLRSTIWKISASLKKIAHRDFYSKKNYNILFFKQKITIYTKTYISEQIREKKEIYYVIFCRQNIRN